MSFLIDTCCVSELIKPMPDPNVIRWFEDHDEREMFLSVLTLGELRKGIETLADSKRKGHPIPDISGLLAATAIANGLTVVTRNTKDMIATGVSLIDPWAKS